MRRFRLTLRFPGSGPLIGGHAGHATGAHAVHAMDHVGRPVIPSTAIRGALRESLEALLRATGKKACVGGDGRDPMAVPEREATDAVDATYAADGAGGAGTRVSIAPPERGPCTLDAGERCVPCRLFGSPRPGMDAGESAFSGLVLEPARLASPFAGWMLRPGVAIDRRRRSAQDRALVIQRVPAGRDLCFVARGRLRVPALAAELEAAARATAYVGAGRSRGPAQVEVSLDWEDTAAGAAGEAGQGAGAEAGAATATGASASVSRAMGQGDVYVRMTLDAPASLGVAVVERNFRDTRLEVPGAAVRGTVGFALAELIENANDDPGFQALVDAERGAHFGFLYPVDRDTPRAGGVKTAGAAEIMGAVPITAQACKTMGRAHGVRDVLLDRLALSLADSIERAGRAEDDALQGCPVCEGPLRSVAGSRRAHEAPHARGVTRVAMDRARGSARDEHLFTEMRIEAGTCFEGTIRNVPADARALLARALGSGLLSLGRGRAMGWGRVHMEVDAGDVAPAARLPPVAKRAAGFEEALRARLRGMPAADGWASRLVPVTLLSPLVPSGDEGGDAGRDDDDDGAWLLEEALDGRCHLRLRRFAREGTWDQSRGKMEARWAVAAGGVFVIDLGPDRRWRDVVAAIEKLERHGVGARRHQGFGQVLCFDPFFLTGLPARSQDSDNGARAQPAREHDEMDDLSQRIRPHRKELVKAAEEAMAGITGGRNGKSQLNRLVAVCNEAACAEEIESYLRYQAGRSGGDLIWKVPLVERVIEGIEPVLEKLPAAPDGSPDDGLRVAAWRLYAVYMTRRFTYQIEAAKPDRPAKPARDNDRHAPRGPRAPGRRS